MPGQSGLEFTLENKDKINTPIILLTAKGEASERIEGLEIGASVSVNGVCLTAVEITGSNYC